MDGTTKLAGHLPWEEEDIGDPDIFLAHTKLGDDIRQGCDDDGVFQSAEKGDDGAGDKDGPEAGRGLEIGNAIIGLVPVAGLLATSDLGITAVWVWLASGCLGCHGCWLWSEWWLEMVSSDCLRPLGWLSYNKPELWAEVFKLQLDTFFSTWRVLSLGACRGPQPF